MKKTLAITLISSSLMMAVDYKMVLDETISLDAEKKVKLQLFEEAKDYDKSKPIKIKINEMKGENLFSFFDNSKNTPIYDFGAIKINKKMNKNKLIDLVSAVSILDLDANGKNEIMIYGEYYNSMIEHGTGKLLVLEENSHGIEQKIPMIEAHDYYEMKAYPKEQIIIVAQHNIDTEKKGLDNHYLYSFYIYEMKNPLTKIPILLSKKRINRNNKNIINTNLAEILAKYKLYKGGEVSTNKEVNILAFVKSYWLTISNNDDLKFIEKHFKDKVASSKEIKGVEFTLDDFLTYKKNGKYHIEYLKSSTLEYKNNKTQTLYRKSLMVIDEVDGEFMIEAEKDLRVLSDSEIF